MKIYKFVLLLKLFNGSAPNTSYSSAFKQMSDRVWRKG